MVNKVSTETTLNSEKQNTPAIPAYFLSLTVENVRCFGPRQTLNLSDNEGRPAQWTIILGDNGVGKTTILQSIVALLPVSRPFQRGLVSYAPKFYEEAYDWNPHRGKIDDNPYYLSASFFRGAKLAEEHINGDKVEEWYVQGGSDWRTTYYIPDEEMSRINCFGYGASRRIGEA